MAATATYVPWQGAEFKPRDWQARLLPTVQRAIVSGRRGVIHACTGAGKSVLLAEIVAWARAADARIVVTVPSQDLVRQLSATIRRRVGDVVGCFYADAKDPFRPVVVTCTDSVPSLVAHLRRVGATVDLWIADEAHKTETELLIEAAEAMAARRAIGFTATPYRSDSAETLSLWDDVVASYTIGDALSEGVLVPWEVIHWDGKGCNKRDINAICTRLILAHADGPGIVSARSIEDAEEYAEELTAAGVPSEAIHSRLAKAARGSLLARLQAGDLTALVHVNLLSEGVDMPWLRWLCMRRRVQARVRFVQEVGRVIRCHPGKTRAVIMDPYDLFAKHGVTHPAALGEADPKEEQAVEEEDPFPYVDLPPADQEVPAAVAVDAVGAWSRALLRLMQTAGLYVPDPRWAKMDAKWRRNRATEKQAAALGRMAVWARYMPAEHRESIRAVCAAPERLRAGVAGDLMNVLSCIAAASEAHRKVRRHWPWPDVLEVHPLPDRVVRALGAG